MKRLGLLSLLLVLMLGGTAHARRYFFYLLPPLDNYAYSYANAINNKGEIVGFSVDLAGNTRATYWDPANGYATVDIGTLLGFNSSNAQAINDSGDVVGVSFNRQSSIYRAFIWNKADSIKQLQGLPGSDSDEVFSIAINGKASGRSNARACIFQRDQPAQDISAGFSNVAVGSCESGRVVGNEESYRTNNIYKAVIGQGDFRTITALAPQGSSTPGGSSASAVNRRGAFTGSAQFGELNYHAFLWWNDNLYDLRTLGGSFSQGRAINDSGDVVGWSYTSDGNTRAFLFKYSANSMMNLNDLNVTGRPTNYELAFQEARGINNQGEIVGTTNRGVAYLLRPIALDLTAFVLMLLLSD